MRGAELIVEYPDGIVGARLTWPEDEVTFADDGCRSVFTARAIDTSGRLAVTLVVEASRQHDVVAKHAVIMNVEPLPVS